MEDPFRTDKRTIHVPWEKVEELIRRLDPVSKEATDAIRGYRGRRGVVWTPWQKLAAVRVLDTWLTTETVDDLGPELMELRDALHEDLERV